jgi:cytochrome c551
MSNETLFFICGGILAASAVSVSVFGLKAGDNFPGKWMPVIIIWFAAFAVLSGTFAVLHGKDESRDHSAEYSKASEEIEKNETTGPFEEAQTKQAEAEKAESEESSEGGESSEEEGESSESGAPAEGEGSETAAGGDAESGTVVFSENCSTCHGATGHGGNGGPDLTTMPLAQSEAGAIEQVTNGGGGMPAFAGTLSEEEIENVAAYVAQDITEGEPKE